MEAYKSCPNQTTGSPEIKSTSSNVMSKTITNKLLLWVQYFDIFPQSFGAFLIVGSRWWAGLGVLTSVNGVVGGWPDDGQSQSGKEEELRIGIEKRLLLGQKRENSVFTFASLNYHFTPQMYFLGV